MDYVKALAVLVIMVFILSLVVGAGMAIILTGMAIGAAVLVAAVVFAVLRSIWEWGTNLWGS